MVNWFVEAVTESKNAFIKSSLEARSHRGPIEGTVPSRAHRGHGTMDGMGLGK